MASMSQESEMAWDHSIIPSFFYQREYLRGIDYANGSTWAKPIMGFLNTLLLNHPWILQCSILASWPHNMLVSTVSWVKHQVVQTALAHLTPNYGTYRSANPADDLAGPSVDGICCRNPLTILNHSNYYATNNVIDVGKRPNI